MRSLFNTKRVAIVAAMAMSFLGNSYSHSLAQTVLLSQDFNDNSISAFLPGTGTQPGINGVTINDAMQTVELVDTGEVNTLGNAIYEFTDPTNAGTGRVFDGTGWGWTALWSNTRFDAAMLADVEATLSADLGFPISAPFTPADHDGPVTTIDTSNSGPFPSGPIGGVSGSETTSASFPGDTIGVLTATQIGGIIADVDEVDLPTPDGTPAFGANDTDGGLVLRMDTFDASNETGLSLNFLLGVNETGYEESQGDGFDVIVNDVLLFEGTETVLENIDPLLGTVYSGEFTEVTLDLSAFDGVSELVVDFVFETSAGGENLAIDNIELTSGGLGADLDSDGDVDGADFLAIQRSGDFSLFPVWSVEYGSGVAAVSASVPEPSTLSLALFVLAGLVSRRR